MQSDDRKMDQIIEAVCDALGDLDACVTVRLLTSLMVATMAAVQAHPDNSAASKREGIIELENASLRIQAYTTKALKELERSEDSPPTTIQ